MKMYRGHAFWYRLAALIATACIALFHVLVPSALPNVLYHAATPIVRGWEATINWFADIIVVAKSKQTLARENEFLASQLSLAQERLLTLEKLQSDFKALRVLYGRPEETENPKKILAAVLVSPPLSPYDTLVIDVGVPHGVASGDLVRSLSGLPVGRISEVFRDFSRVTLLSSPGSEIPVRFGAKGMEGRAIGVGNGIFQLLLPRELSLSVGDTVFFPELSPSPLGVVNSVEYQKTDFLQLVSFKSPVNIHEISYVLVDSFE